MAMVDTPTQEHFRSWSYDKMGGYNNESPPSEISSGEFYDAEERVRISNTMEQLKAALKDHTQPGFDEEYQSSEEALSPMLQDEAAATEEEVTTDDESAGEESEDEFDLVSELEAKAFKIDIAIAMCVTSAGKAHIINVPQRWSAFRGRQSQRFDPRSGSRSPPPPSRSIMRPALRTNSSISQSSTSQSRSSSISRPETPEVGKYARHTPIVPHSHRTASSTASAGSLASSSNGAQSLHSFLNSDPYELSQPQPQPSKTTTRSKLRNVSSKLIASLNSPTVESPISDDASIRSSRRRSMTVSSRPDTASTVKAENVPFFFSQRSRDEWYREHSQPVRSQTPPPGVMELQGTTPARGRFPKMVARGANERAPMLELPPCPKDYDMEIPALKSYDTMPAGGFGKKASSTNLRRRQSLLGMRN
jgi:hypothetical protein